MYRLKEGTFSPRFGIDSPFLDVFLLGNNEMVPWIVGHS